MCRGVNQPGDTHTARQRQCSGARHVRLSLTPFSVNSRISNMQSLRITNQCSFGPYPCILVTDGSCLQSGGARALLDVAIPPSKAYEQTASVRQ